MDKNKILNLIGTGTAAAALLIVATLFNSGGFSNLTAAASTGQSVPAQAVQIDAASLEEQNVQLQDALMLMQQREAEYQVKLDEANHMLLNPEPAASYGEGGEGYEEEYEEHEEHEDEHEYEEHEDEHEYEEHEEHEDEHEYEEHEEHEDEHEYEEHDEYGDEDDD